MGVFIRQTTVVKKSGFTMAELMIAVGIIAMLTIRGFVTMQNQTQRARDQRRQSDLEQIRQALGLYRLSTPTRTYPTPVPGEPFVVLANDLANFLPQIPRDPLQDPTLRRYAYSSANNGNCYFRCAELEGHPPAGGGSNCGWSLQACIPGTNRGCNLELNQP